MKGGFSLKVVSGGGPEAKPSCMGSPLAHPQRGPQAWWAPEEKLLITRRAEIIGNSEKPGHSLVLQPQPPGGFCFARPPAPLSSWVCIRAQRPFCPCTRAPRRLLPAPLPVPWSLATANVPVRTDIIVGQTGCLCLDSICLSSQTALCV